MTQMMMDGGNMSGITIPTATDIAFALGVFTVFQSSMPEAMKPFILALATVDDLGAIGIIVVTGGGGLNLKFCVAAAFILYVSAEIGRKPLKDGTLKFAFPGVALWYCMLKGGINADIAGVVIAMCIPV